MEFVTRYGAPDKETIGHINDLYVDLDTNDVYRCTSIKTNGEECGDAIIYASTLDNTEYTWELVGGSGGGNVVLAEKQELIFNADNNYSATIQAATFEEWIPGDAYLVHVKINDVEYDAIAVSGSSFITVAEFVAPYPNSIVEEEIGDTYMYLCLRTLMSTEFNIHAFEGNYTISLCSEREYWDVNDTLTIAIEHVVSALS